MARVSWRAMIFCAGGGMAALLGALIGCSSTADEGERAVAISRNGVQWDYISTSESSTGSGVNLLTASSTTRKGKSTGALRHRSANGNAGNCGVTFISHHYAVTASHCVSAGDGFVVGGANPTTFQVEQFDTHALDVNAVGNQSYVTALYNNDVTSWYRQQALSPSNGYAVTSYTCTVRQRCDASGSFGPRTNDCPGSVDNALVYCSARPSTGLNWVPVRTSDPQNLNVEIWWFHEILYLSTDQYDHPYQPIGNPAHYNYLDTSNDLNNYHYYQNQNLPNNTAQMLPLRSKWAMGGVPYRALNAHTNGTNYVDTNVAGCHGTSGSGVFAANEDTLLGNVVHGGTWATSYECDPYFDAGAQSVIQLDYVSRTETAKLEAQSFVLGDRQP